MSILLSSKLNAKAPEKDQVHLFFKFSQMEKFSPSEGKLSGVAVPYGEATQDYRKVAFKSGAFKKIKKVPFFVNHESYDVRSLIGVSNFSDSKNSLNFSAEINLKDSFVLEKIIPLIEMGALEGVSIGAYVLAKEDLLDKDGKLISTIITEAEAFELSLVTFQAFESAKIKLQKENDMPLDENTEDQKPIEEVPAEPNPEAPVEEAPVEEAPVEEAPVEEAPVEEAPVEEAPVEEEKMSQKSDLEKLQADLKVKDEEIAKLKFEKVESAKQSLVNQLIENGIVYKSQSERIMKSFASAEAIQEFYKDVPASFSVKPKGENQKDVVDSQIKSEVYKKLSSQTSGLSVDDFEKYNK